MLELRQDPFKSHRLRTHDLGKGRNGKKVFSSDVGGISSDRRIIWQVFNKTIVVLLYGTHAVQDRVKRMRIDFDPNDRIVTVYIESPDSGSEQTYQQRREQSGSLFITWSDAELRSFGFPDEVVKRLRSLQSEDELLSLEDVLDEHFEPAFNLVATGDVSGVAPDQVESVEAIEPEVTESDREIERQLENPNTAGWFTRSEPEFLQDVLGRPIEDWMIFLHPDQRSVARKRYEGAARVRGAAGTGKTVVGLHRAAFLAETNREVDEAKPVLFTTYIKSLPPVFESLFHRMPGTRSGEVEFVHIDKLASAVCRDMGARPNTDLRGIDAAWRSAFKRIVKDGSPLAEGGFARQYLRDEITAVIKGRGIDSLDTYLEIARTGRRAPMSKSVRSQVWELMDEWNAQMATRGTVDFVDVVVQARNHARTLDSPMYSAAIIDEAQDLSLVGLQLVRALVNAPGVTDRPNGLMLLGDGAQRIYAGGFKLRQAGVEVRGRTTVLKVNYRNTNEIIGTAMAVAGDAEVDDLGEEFRRGEESADTQRHGPKPLLIETSGIDHQLDEIAERVRSLTEDEFGLGDIGVLVPTNRLVDEAVNRLEAEGIGTQKLDSYDGRPNELVKVGTYHRGKGLEFKVVFLPGVSKGSFPRVPNQGENPAEVAESRELAISQLFVAMTRARDLLVVLYEGEPTEEIAARLERFDWVDA